MTRQTFTKAFKLEAVRLLDAGKRPAAEIARELGIKREKLYRWREQRRSKGPRNPPPRNNSPIDIRWQKSSSEDIRAKISPIAL